MTITGEVYVDVGRGGVFRSGTGLCRVCCTAWAQKEFSVGHRDRQTGQGRAGRGTGRGETTGRLLDYCRALYRDRAGHGNRSRDVTNETRVRLGQGGGVWGTARLRLRRNSGVGWSGERDGGVVMESSVESQRGAGMGDPGAGQQGGQSHGRRCASEARSAVSGLWVRVWVCWTGREESGRGVWLCVQDCK